MIDLQRSERAAVISISGRFDFRCVKEFQSALVPGPTEWIVELSGVEYIDSAGLGLLLLLRDHAGERPVKLRGVRGQVRDVLLMAKLDRMFRLES
jgi:anti-anti-sigma factor